MSGRRLIAFVRGGLGNQMFIYAAARRLAIKNDARLILDPKSYENEFQGREFLLSNFSIAGEISQDNSQRILYSKRKHRLAARINRYLQPLSAHFPHYFIERTKTLLGRKTRYDRRVLEVQIHDYLFMDGLFLDEGYFSDIADVIREDFRLKSPPSQSTKELAQEMSQTNSVCLHFRRTELERADLINRHQSDSGLAGYRQGLGQDYYLKALKIIEQQVSSPRFFIFSDYPDWVKDHIQLPAQSTHVTHNNNPSMCHEDLYLMSLCKHHVISHSTFGWWGAWLAENPDQIVVAPINICARPKPPYYPATWTTLEVCQKKVSKGA